jgi:hypothetical protein
MECADHSTEFFCTVRPAQVMTLTGAELAWIGTSAVIEVGEFTRYKAESFPLGRLSHWRVPSQGSQCEYLPVRS